MKTLQLQKGTTIKTGNHLISIGTFSTSEIAIISPFTHDFIKLEKTKTNKKLKKAKRLFKSHLCSETDFCFRHFTDDMTRKLIDILK
tara:strand:- start:1264 stop:1524 length:261 start_codon:yes stop_codon:yes gene_type:complete